MSQDDPNAQQLLAAIADESVPKIYFNGFLVSCGTGDAIILLKRNDLPVAVLNASHTMVKTLSVQLGAVLSELEQAFDMVFPTTRELEMKIGDARNANPD